MGLCTVVLVLVRRLCGFPPLGWALGTVSRERGWWAGGWRVAGVRGAGVSSFYRCCRLCVAMLYTLMGLCVSFGTLCGPGR